MKSFVAWLRSSLGARHNLANAPEPVIAAAAAMPAEPEAVGCKTVPILKAPQPELLALIAVAPPPEPDRFTSGNNEPPHYLNVTWGEIVEQAKRREVAPREFYNRLSMCAGIWFLYTGGFETPSPHRPVDLNIRWQRQPDGKYILADFARLGFWDNGIESVLARTMMDVLVPLEGVQCSETPDADGLFHSSIVRGTWRNDFTPNQWLAFLDELDGEYYHSWFGADVRGAREALERFGAIPHVPPSERPATKPPQRGEEEERKPREPTHEASETNGMYPIPPYIQEAFHNLRGMFDECGYSLAYERTAEHRPEGHRYWKWAMWEKPCGKSRIEISLDEYGGLDVWSFLSDHEGLAPRIKSAAMTLNYSIPDTRELSPADVKQIDEFFDKWQKTILAPRTRQEWNR